MPVKTKNAKKPVVLVIKKKKANGEGYAGHREGSRKAKVHQMYDKLGPDKARPLAAKLVAAGTVNSWFSEFKNSKAKAASKN